jgi:hypothetical protein
MYTKKSCSQWEKTGFQNLEPLTDSVASILMVLALVVVGEPCIA